MSEQTGFKEWAYRKAAWALDDLNESIEDIYRTRGVNGIMQIKGLGRSLSNQIEKILTSA